jgi:SnoaL-like domain
VNDYVAIRRLQDAYADVVTRRAWDELGRLFLPDVTIEVDTLSAPAVHVTGPAEFAAFVGPATDRFDHFQFVILNAVVEVDGDDAAGRIFMSEIRHHADDTDAWSTAYGIYQDRYRRLDGQWWFADRRYRSLARTGPQSGVFGLPPDLPPLGR